ncbi:hypothetical protein [Streptomyces sp. SID2119]|uniref:hypothetical protein n=1 Tax=Streptomyces sp. SID2119 TaxID=2690253 RepID=UPI001F479E47|nr:hypothetical protein [Streptomyces sp. SID2119]
MSGRPVYAPFPERAAGPKISMPLRDDDAGKPDLALGQTHHLLDDDGEGLARDLVRSAKLTLRRDGGHFHPMTNGNWTDATYEAVLTLDRALAPEFTTAMAKAIRQRLKAVFKQLERDDAQSPVIEAALRPLPEITQDWRHRGDDPTKQAGHERQSNQGYPAANGPTFASRAELAVYQILQDLRQWALRRFRRMT